MAGPFRVASLSLERLAVAALTDDDLDGRFEIGA